MLDNNLERRPITIELNLNAVTLCGGESLPVSSLTFNPQLAPKPHQPTNDLRLSLETQNGLPLNPASEDPAVDSGLKAVSLFKRHGLLAYNITPPASLEGSILLCNDYRHASPPAHSESRGVVDVQVDFTGIAIYARIAPYKTGYAGVPHRSAEH